MFQQVVRLLLSLPSSRLKMATELGQAREQVRSTLTPKVYPNGAHLTTVKTLPEKGKGKEWLEEEWRNMKLLDKGDVSDGRVSGTVYHVSGLSFSRLVGRLSEGPIYFSKMDMLTPRAVKSSTRSSTKPWRTLFPQTRYIQTFSQEFARWKVR